MGREVRKVPADWQHPINGDGRYIPLFGDSYAKILAKWEKGKQQWDNGFREDWDNPGQWKPIEPKHQMPWEEWNGEKPRQADYMPDWPDEQRTHLMMYENTSEGTPISPAFKTPEQLARWLTDNNASAFGNMTATYEQWLVTCRVGWAVSGLIGPSGIMSGVEASESLFEKDQDR